MAVSEPLYGKNPAELAALCAETGLPRFAARQLARWLYVKHIEDPMLMTDIPAARRALLAERFRQVLTPPERVTESADGTKKYLFRTQQGAYIESAYIPDGDRATLCVSSQAGCRMGCKFCATGRQGLQHSLTAAEILNQIVSLPERDTLTNVVFMGMGEPLDNTDNVLRALDILTAEWGFGWSPTRITLSTAGVVPELRRLLDSTKVHLAVSLHNPFHEERAGDHARRTGMAGRRGRGNPAPIRLHAPAPRIVRIHRHERAERLAAAYPRTVPPAGRHQVPHQPDPVP